MAVVLPPPSKLAFSLVELSIVLVILGLLTGGILAGKSLIRASELRAVSTEYQRYYTAAQAFRDKYFALPGDFREATKFWGRLNSNADCVTNSSASVASPGVCDGNGDGSIPQVANASGGAGEVFQIWRHLALAGLIEGEYTGLSESGNTGGHVPGTNSPRSRVTNAGWGMDNVSAYGDNYMYYYTYTNTLMVGKALTSYPPVAGAFRPEEAWNIDTKLDDGKPGLGKIVGYSGSWASWGGASACTTSANNTDYSGDYNLTYTSLACSLIFMKQL